MSRLVVFALLLAACTNGASPALGAPGSLPDGPSALVESDHPDLPPARVDLDALRPGGPPPDGIPSIDQPKFRSIAEAELSLAETEPVIVVEINDEVRAYPVEIMMWHEIVNDEVGGTPVAVTYCPLCNSAVTFERVLNGVELTFGTSGLLYASALVMYDRQTESLWTHIDGRAVAGVLAGVRLQAIPSPLMAWADFKRLHPDAVVLSRDTGYSRQYGRNPYYAYDSPETRPFFFHDDADDRALIKQRVVGIEVGGDSVAIPLEILQADTRSVTPVRVGESDLVVFWQAGQNSALEGADTAVGRDVGSVAVFEDRVDELNLDFEARGGGFVDRQTGTTWDLAGRAIDGPLHGSRLQPVPHLDTFWFAWSSYQPGTELVTR